MNLKISIGVNGGTREYKFGEVTEVTIGREDDNLISPIVDSISRHHARIFFKEDAWFVEDLDSTNGSFKGDERLAAKTPVKVLDGDKFRFGKVEIVFELLGAPVASVVKELPKPATEPVVPSCTQNVKLPEVAPVAAVPPPKAPEAMLEPVDDIPELKPEEMKPVAPAEAAAGAEAPKSASPLSPISPAKPVLKKPVLGGGLKPGLKLPPRPGAAGGLKPGLKLPPKPAAGGLRPGLKLPGKPA